MDPAVVVIADKTIHFRKLSIRVALGALIIQERLGTDDRETLRQILEKPYLQYFLGLPEYQYRRPFHHSLMTHFRKRLGGEIIDEVNAWIALEESRNNSESPDQSDDGDDPSGGAAARTSDESAEPQPRQMERTNEGELLLDATCATSAVRPILSRCELLCCYLSCHSPCKRILYQVHFEKGGYA